MSNEDKLIALIDIVYAAVLDITLWPMVLAKLADATGTMQTIIATMDRRMNHFDSISRRTIAELDASYKNHWAFHNPLWAKSATLPAGAVYSLDSLMPRQDFAKTPIFNEWWKPAEYSLAMLGANLQSEDRVFSVLCAVNAPANDVLTNEQIHAFTVAARHLARAVRIHSQLWMLGHKQVTAMQRFEDLSEGAILVDADANVLYLNPVAQTMLDTSNGIVLEGSCLASLGGNDTLQRLIASCARATGPLRGPLGGSFEVRRGPHRVPLRLTVTPLRSKDLAVEISWLGLRTPVALVTITDPEISRRRLVQDLHERFGLTAAEAGLAAEIAKGDGRDAAARRRGISVTTARAQLSSIFEKTGTHRQAELVHLLLKLSDKSNLEKRDS